MNKHNFGGTKSRKTFIRKHVLSNSDLSFMNFHRNHFIHSTPTIQQTTSACVSQTMCSQSKRCSPRRSPLAFSSFIFHIHTYTDTSFSLAHVHFISQENKWRTPTFLNFQHESAQHSHQRRKSPNRQNPTANLRDGPQIKSTPFSGELLVNYRFFKGKLIKICNFKGKNRCFLKFVLILKSFFQTQLMPKV